MKKLNQSFVVLFGTATDPEVKHSADLIKKTGRDVKFQRRPSFDTGIGHCGKHICSCKTVCAANDKNIVADQGPMMGMSY